MKQVRAAVISNGGIMPGVHLIWLKSPEIASIAQPGQFVMVRCGDGSGFPLPRPLSIHRRDGGRIALLFAVVGRGTEWLSQRKAGDTIDIFGPLGNGFSIAPDSKHMLLVAGGLGIAPLCFLAQRALDEGKSVTLLSGASTAAQLYPAHLLPSEARLVTATEDGSTGHKGMVTSLLRDFIGRADQVFACGPMPMYRDIIANRRWLSARKPVQVSLEVRMGCGLGVCYGCTIKTKNGLKQVCRDGPVFDLDDIIWDKLNC